MSWQPIETAPRDRSNILAYYLDNMGHEYVTEAWWDVAFDRWSHARDCSEVDQAKLAS